MARALGCTTKPSRGTPGYTIGRRSPKWPHATWGGRGGLSGPLQSMYRYLLPPLSQWAPASRCDRRSCAAVGDALGNVGHRPHDHDVQQGFHFTSPAKCLSGRRSLPSRRGAAQSYLQV